MYAIIGGSSLATLAALGNPRRKAVATPFGAPSADLTFGELAGREVVFLGRHGDGHTIAPHELNYRANLWALKEAGATAVIAVASVGGIRADFGPGALVVPDQIIDYTHSRKATFFEGGAPVTHIDFTWPYSPDLRGRLLDAASRCALAVADGGVYACAQGPRLETAAEIERIARDGGDLVGMTGMPEAALAREIELSYAALCVVVNHAAGRGASRESISLADIEAVSREAIARVVQVIEATIAG